MFMLIAWQKDTSSIQRSKIFSCLHHEVVMVIIFCESIALIEKNISSDIINFQKVQNINMHVWFFCHFESLDF